MIHQRNDTLDQYHRRELEILRRGLDAGVTVAVPAALHYCLEHRLPAPEWLCGAALTLLCDLLKREKSKKRGRSTSAVARYRQDLVDFIRWNEAIVLREKQTRAHQTVNDYATIVDPSCRLYREEVQRAEWLGRSMETIFQCVSEVLEETEAFGSPESMKRSYHQVNRNHKDPVKVYRHLLLHPLFIQMLGLTDDLGYGQHAKIAAWRTSPRTCRRDGV